MVPPYCISEAQLARVYEVIASALCSLREPAHDGALASRGRARRQRVVYFISLADLIAQLAKAEREGTLIHDSRSRIMNSMRASERLCCAWTTRTLNIETGSNRGLPPYAHRCILAPLPVGCGKAQNPQPRLLPQADCQPGSSRSKCSDSENRVDGRISDISSRMLNHISMQNAGGAGVPAWASVPGSAQRAHTVVGPRYVVAFPEQLYSLRLVIEAKARRITVVDRRGPLGTRPHQ